MFYYMKMRVSFLAFLPNSPTMFSPLECEVSAWQKLQARNAVSPVPITQTYGLSANK